MTDQPTSKSEIREEALRRRNEITAAARADASLAICRRMMDDDQFLDAGGIHVYLPIGSEVDIAPLINVAWEMGKKVGLMRVMDDGGILQYEIRSATKYRKSKLGILEPVDAELFDMNECDLVITPIVAADEQCNRIGYGKGYYDQFLAQYPRPSVGVAFEAQIFPTLPVDEGDFKVDAVYTESRIIGDLGSNS